MYFSHIYTANLNRGQYPGTPSVTYCVHRSVIQLNQPCATCLLPTAGQEVTDIISLKLIADQN